ncbi:H-NS histone family protein [Halovulum sp. GXIMD14794]
MFLDKAGLDELTDKELEELRADIVAILTIRRQRRAAAALRTVEDIATQHGFSVEQLLEHSRGIRHTGKPPHKYRHPLNPKLTWRGLGRPPKWIKELLANGTSLEEIEINQL